MDDQRHPEPGEGREPRGIRRRTVLKGAAIGAGAVVVAAAGGITVRGWLNGVWNVGEGTPYELWDRAGSLTGPLAIVAAATLAANPHNMQPWRFAVTGDTIELSSDPARSMPHNDADGRERAAGFGCALENMAVAARAQGLAAHIDVLPGGEPSLIARVTLSPSTAPTADERLRAQQIPLRHTNRGPFGPDAVDTQALTRAAGDVPGAEVVWVTDPAARERLGALYVEATEAIVADEAMSVEAFSWFRSSRADIDRYRDGLTLDCQGLDAFTTVAAKVLPAQSRQDGDAFWVRSTREVHTATAAAYGIVRVTEATGTAARIAAGRLLERLHLDATARGVALHHMNQIGERVERDAATGSPDAFGARWAEITGVPAGEVVASFRVGIPQRTPGRSPRRALEDVVTA